MPTWENDWGETFDTQSEALDDASEMFYDPNHEFLLDYLCYQIDYDSLLKWALRQNFFFDDFQKEVDAAQKDFFTDFYHEVEDEKE